MTDCLLLSIYTIVIGYLIGLMNLPVLAFMFYGLSVLFMAVSLVQPLTPKKRKPHLYLVKSTKN